MQLLIFKTSLVEFTKPPYNAFTLYKLFVYSHEGMSPTCLISIPFFIAQVTPERGLCVEEYLRYKGLGRATLRDRGKTLAVGVVTKIIGYG